MISFVIPVYNEEEDIVETLRLLRQGVGDIPHEIIITDDGSTDATVEKVRGFADHVVRYRGETPKTIGANRNRGAKVARFPITMFLDSDVRIREPHVFFPKVLEHFASDPKLVAMTASVRVYPGTETLSDKVVLSFFDAYFRFANNVLKFGVTHGKCMIVRAETFVRVGGFQEHMAASEDADLFIRLSKIGRTMLDPSLRIYFSGRRAHAVGWPALLTQWTLNGIWIVVFKRSYSDKWGRADTPGKQTAPEGR
ncbi:MAG: glycosyltransferase [Patescibacteria group bacterium]|nr:glycosyltransferase [bacterium]MDZ4227338.1 glycosyltransferase [Patescibacteria group bacterium]